MHGHFFEEFLIRAFNVELYADVYERLARSPLPQFRRLAARGISDKLRNTDTIFIHIAKNIGTSVNKCFYGCNIGHRSAMFYCQADRGLYKQLFVFSVLRDPVARFTSACNMFLNEGSTFIQVHPRLRKRYTHIRSIRDILKWVELSKTNVYKIDVMFRPQTWFIRSPSGQILVDKLFLLGEDDAELANFILQRTGRELPHSNRATQYSVRLTDDEEAQVKVLYAEDYDLIRQFRVLPMRRS